jgi:hypothetical protein
MKATHVKDLPTSASGAIQALYRLDPPLSRASYDDDIIDVIEYVVVSAVAVLGQPETFIFPADGNGDVLDWLELPGSYRGGYDHEEALDGLLSSQVERGNGLDA